MLMVFLHLPLHAQLGSRCAQPDERNTKRSTSIMALATAKDNLPGSEPAQDGARELTDPVQLGAVSSLDGVGSSILPDLIDEHQIAIAFEALDMMHADTAQNDT